CTPVAGAACRTPTPEALGVADVLQVRDKLQVPERVVGLHGVPVVDLVAVRARADEGGSDETVDSPVVLHTVPTEPNPQVAFHVQLPAQHAARMRPPPASDAPHAPSIAYLVVLEAHDGTPLLALLHVAHSVASSP